MFFINPFIYAAGADFESIATVTVGSGGASAIEFTSIPGTYQHLQIRMIARVSRASTAFSNVQLSLNGDTTASNYARHILQGDGASAAAAGNASTNYNFLYGTANDAPANVFAANIIDILDYASSSKATTMRTFLGWDTNNSGTAAVAISSGLWTSTSAVTSVRLQDTTAFNFAQHTTAALYGIKAP